MNRTCTKEKAYKPNSLLALSVEAAAKCYKFDPRDLFSYHRQIDVSHLHAAALTTQYFGHSINTRLPRWLMRRLPQNISTFMLNRKRNIHKLYTELATRIVNFGKIHEIDEIDGVLRFGVNPLPKLRQKYVKYAQQMVEIEKLGIMVNKGDQLQKLLMCIQRERLWLKQNSKNLGPDFLAGGDGPYVITEDKPMEIYANRTEGKVIKKKEDRTGGKDKAEMASVLQGRSNRHNERNVNVSNCAKKVDDDDESIVLYGMICA